MQPLQARGGGRGGLVDMLDCNDEASVLQGEQLLLLWLIETQRLLCRLLDTVW